MIALINLKKKTGVLVVAHKEPDASSNEPKASPQVLITLANVKEPVYMN